MINNRRLWKETKIPVFSRFSLSQKAVLLVVALLCCELIFIGILTALLYQAEHEIWQESHARRVIAETNNLTSLCYQAGVCLYARKLTMSDTFGEQYDRLYMRILDEADTLKKLTREDPSGRISAAKVEGRVGRAVGILQKLNNMTNGKNQISRFFDEMNIKLEIESDCNRAMKELQELVREEEAAVPNSNKETVSRAQVKNALFFGIIANIIVAILACLFLVRRITSRLQILLDNTVRLGKKEELHAPLSGSDEITTLDGMFHRMARSLAEAERLKQDFVEMISHDLRSPLSAILATLGALDRGLYGELDEKGKQRISAA